MKRRDHIPRFLSGQDVAYLSVMGHTVQHVTLTHEMSAPHTVEEDIVIHYRGISPLN